VTTGVIVTKRTDRVTAVTGWRTRAGGWCCLQECERGEIRLKHNLPVTKEATKGKSWASKRPSFLPKKCEEKRISFCLLVACDLNTLQLDQQIHLAKSKENKLLFICWAVFVESKTEGAMHCPGVAEQRRGTGNP